MLGWGPTSETLTDHKNEGDIVQVQHSLSLGCARNCTEGGVALYSGRTVKGTQCYTILTIGGGLRGWTPTDHKVVAYLSSLPSLYSMGIPLQALLVAAAGGQSLII